ncbi:hypothetical protein [Paenibacillus sp. DMB5]|uniref:hypothetical protein n=1 Tax=Paenibacillus sp. DMB5 TaxID=1780103 RepID=UPI000AFC91F5|nr:hypothetical protein [Paenibacillus sp. DMB5]
MNQKWNAGTYDADMAFVSQYGQSLVELLKPQPVSASWTGAAAPGIWRPSLPATALQLPASMPRLK